MNIAWAQGFNQGPLLRLLRNILDKHSQLTPFDGQSLEAYALLRSMLEFPAGTPWHTRNDLIEKGVQAAVEREDWDAKSLLQAIRDAGKQHLAKPGTTHILYTSINVAHGALQRSVRSGDVQLTFSPKFPAKVAKARREMFKDASRWMSVSEDPPLTSVRASLDVRSFEEAAAKALDAIDLFRGICNLVVSKGWRRTFSGPPKAVNQVLLGPFHSFHTASGAAASAQFWYEPAFGKTISFFDPGAQTQDFLKATTRIRTTLSRHAYRAEVEHALVRFARALDLADHDQAILRLWALLEYLTDTGRSNYETTVRRARFLFVNTDHAKLVLDHLRQYRNRSVHGGRGEADVEVEVYQLQRYVKAMIEFHLLNGRRYQSIQSAAALLDLSTDISRLENEIELRRHALQLRTPRDG